MNRDEDRFAARLRAYLRENADHDPLPHDFAVEVAEHLPDRKQETQRPKWALVAFALTAVAVLAAVAFTASLLRSPIATSSATPHPGAGSGEPSPSSAPTLSHYADDTIRFDYPAAWRIIERGINARHYQWIPVVLGTGDWKLNCHAIPPSSGNFGGITCGADIFTVDPGGVVVELYTWHGPPVSVAQTPPPDAVELSSGLKAIVSEGPSTSLWRVYLPEWMAPLTVEARYREPGVEARREEVRAMVESLVAIPQPSP